MSACDDLPLNLYSAAQVRDLDARLIAAGTPGFELMQRAAHAAWRALRQRWGESGVLTVLAGRGNNAGDGYLIAVLAQRAGWQVRVLAVAEPAQLSGDAAAAFAEAQAGGVLIEPWTAQSALSGVLVDALLGTGLKGEVRAPFRQVIEQINASGLPVLAVDIPSGLCADTGQVLGVAVRAELTVTFIGLKLGLFTGMAADWVGTLRFADLQADAQVVEQVPVSAVRLASTRVVRLTPRTRTAHKGRLGHVLLVGGDRGYGGAILLAAQMALRAGAGLVSLATREEHVAGALSRLPEVMTRGVRSANQLGDLLAAASVLVLGPGLGQQAWGRSLYSAAMQQAGAWVLDADALNLLAQETQVLPEQCILTPHPGEAARLLGCTVSEVQNDRPAAARELARRYGAVVVLKGAGSLVAAADGRLAQCERGHPAMAGAGFGDVLSGLLGALLAQGMSAYEAACLGVWLHACAGEQLGQGGRGLAASDLCMTIRQLLEEHAPCLN